jgi:hypothetical protein
MKKSGKARQRSQTVALTSSTNGTAGSDPTFRSRMCMQAIRRPLNPFPPRFRCIFNGNAIASVAASSGASNHYSFCLNSLYHWLDAGSLYTNFPTFGGGASTSSNPAAYSALVTSDGPYANYRVIGVAVRLECLTANSGDNLEFTLAPVNGSRYGNAFEASAGWGCERRFVGFGQGGRSMISRSWSIADISGVTRQQVMTNDDFSALYNAQPPELCVADVWYATADNATNSGTITFSISIAFDTVLESPQWGVSLEESPALVVVQEDASTASSSASSSSSSSAPLVSTSRTQQNKIKTK